MIAIFYIKFLKLPIINYGIYPLLQLPQFIYDYKLCE